MRKFFGLLLGMVALFSTGAALADDWTATRLRGEVLVAAPGGSGWTRLHRGDVVSDARAIRTLAGGNVEFTRGAETVGMGPGTTAQIVDRNGQLYTTVVEQSGSVAISAEARRVQHFAVQTPYLVAVVKGTRFTVTTARGRSRVAVTRGLVAVTDLLRRATVMVPAGQSVSAAADGGMTVSGRADPAQTHPVVNGVVEDDDSAGTTPGFGDQLAALLGGTVASTGALAGGALDATGHVVGGTLGGVGQAVGGTLGSVGGAVTTTTGSLGSTLGNLGGSTSGDSGGSGSLGGTLGSVGGAVGGVVGGVTGGGGLLHHLGL